MIWLLRHGDASDSAPDDASRPLTEKGERQARAAGAALAAGRGNVLLVGHEPDFSRAIQVATGGHVEMKKGGLAAIEGSALLSLLRPKQIKLLAAG